MNNKRVNFYKKNGYLVLEEFFSKVAFQKLLSITNEIMTSTHIHKQFKDLLDFEVDKDNLKEKVLRRIQTPEVISPFYLEIAKDKNLLSALTKLLGKNIRLEGIKINIKPAHHGSAILWHQDWAFQAYTNDDILTIGIFLDDCSEENAPIYVIPGSHKGPTYRHDSLGVFSGAIDLSQENIPIERATPLIGKAGDITIHHYRSLHYSPENLSAKSRRMLFLRYASADAWPLMGVLDYKEGFTFEKMKDRIVAGEQTVEPRLKKVPIRMPLPYPNSFSSLPSTIRSYGVLESFSGK